MKNIIIACALTVFSVLISGTKSNEIPKIPNFLKICHKKDPKLNECIRESIELLRPKLSDGIPEFLIPACDPLSIPEIVIRQHSGAVHMESEYSNMEISGLSNFTLRSVRLDPVTNKFRIMLWFPSLDMTSDYEIHGKLLLMPLSGSGKSKGNFTDIDATVSMIAGIVHINGKDHYKINKIDVEFNIGGASVELTNLFNGDEELGVAMNRFLNENWREVTAEIRPALAKAIEDILRAITSRLFDFYPLEEILPD